MDRRMERVALGPLQVSRLCLGTMLMGGRTPAEEAPRLLDAYVGAGHNFLDTADTYGDGTSERTLAPWLARRRADVVVATKLRFAVSDPGGSGLAPDRVVAACEASLRRLGVDVIDLYQIHAPDPDVVLEDTLAALDGLVRAGKVRALGASNFPAWLLAWAVGVQDREGLSPFVSLQPQYSLVERSIETEILPFCRAAGLGVLPWGPLGAGFLTGRYSRDEAPPAGTRIGDATDDLEEAIDRRGTEANFRAVDEARAVADEVGASVAQVALAWLLAQPGVTAPIIGPRTLEQLEDLLPAAQLALSDEQVARLGRWTAPARGYPERMLIEQSDIDVGSIRLRRAQA
jgi:aryl-alcohol dehydrogenase-like predicted oxidoreductase